MLTYVIRRILATIPVMAVVALFVFSQGLLAAVPKLSSSLAGTEARLAEMPGVVPSLKERMPGCIFASRCAGARDRRAHYPSGRRDVSRQDRRAGPQAADFCCAQAHFHTRCPHVFARCRREEPALRPTLDGTLVACHLHDQPLPNRPVCPRLP